jgi:hypothetical protein
LSLFRCRAFRLEPADRFGRLTRQPVITLLECCDGTAFEVSDAGERGPVLGHFLFVLGNGDGDGLAGRLDRRRRVADLLAEQRYGLSVEEVLLGLEGPAAQQCQNLFEHSHSSMYEHRSRLSCDTKTNNVQELF